MKTLPARQLKQLKAEIEKEGKEKSENDLEFLLLNGPTATEEEIQTIENNRKAINQWRKKL
ncbi:hypothetical protein MUK70_20710 [Dyadobacter chenwenxiniae]|uniref:Uncharacterized protein n=1 Tax=Dyadobacter chenwenxiniae TaxID=2906456 RepID=A0A9X1TKX6_9BACT|nr:hypothetical protein [Dyadobacter chenwenxiniae]MCF0061663.1 hypothetical protein [Dyadobacter chenwenxiniae]UON81484.1 hypothetical protein MUK70_20710 [Dyadobacter chenwenxiniae]